MKSRALILMFLSAGIFSCDSSTTKTSSGDAPGYHLGGTVKGASASLVVAEGAENLTVAGNGSFTFIKTLASNANYNVTVTAPPTGQTCVVTNGRGVVSHADVTNVAITCQEVSLPTYTVSVTVNGLAPNGSLGLSDGAEQLVILANGLATFPTSLPNNTSYAVTVTSQPRGQTCSVASSAGTVQSANVTAPVVNCVTNNYLLGGALSGLAGQGNIVLANQGDQVTVSANGNFVFDKPVPYEGTFSVTTARQPRGQSCSIAGATGTMGNANAFGVTVTCTNNAYSVGGSVSSLVANENVILINNGSETFSVGSNGQFTFNNPVAYQG